MACKPADSSNHFNAKPKQASKPILAAPCLTSGPTAFMLGNEGQGLSPKQMALCDSFVYIPQVRLMLVLVGTFGYASHSYGIA